MTTTARIRECENRVAAMRRSIGNLQSQRDDLLRRVERLRQELGQALSRGDAARVSALRAQIFNIEAGLDANLGDLEKLRGELHGKEQECCELRRNRGQDAPTEDELRKTIDDPRHWRDGDPALTRFVSDGFQRLYPDDSGE